MSDAAASTSLTLLALGDFDASNESAEILPLDREGAPLRFPSATQALEARIDATPKFWGYGERRRDALDVLLWPAQASCPVFRPDGAQGYPGKSGGQALVYAPESRLVLAAGGNDALVSDAIIGALTFDVATGAVATFDTSEPGVLREPRAFASATTFGGGVLVAGGESPLFGVSEEDLEPRDNAELFDPSERRFVESIELRHARTKHAAVSLLDGATLLVGGRTKAGKVSVALGQLELVDPREKRARIGQQITPRIEPVALRLSDGRVFVGGGKTLEGHVVTPSAEWLTSEAEPARALDEGELPARFARAFVELAGSAVLAVGGCEEREAINDEDADVCANECEHGCPPLDAEAAAQGSPYPYAYDAWWLSADGTPEPVPLGDIVAPRPILLPGSDGSPWLVAALKSDRETPRLFRFNPWQPGFYEVSAPGGARLPRPGFPPPIAVDLDTFVWLDESERHGELWGLRLGTRNRFAQDLAFVLQSDPLEPPRHLVPDRLPTESERYDGRLRLEPSSRAARIFVADTEYADVTVSIHLERVDGAAPAPPRVLLGDFTLGDDACPWPEGSPEAGNVATLTRKGGRAELRFQGAGRACPAPKTRVSLGFQAGSRASLISRIDVLREVERASD